MAPFVGPGPDSPAAVRLREAGEALYGPMWQTTLAAALEPHHPQKRPLNVVVLKRWAAGSRSIPPWVWPALHEIGSDRESQIRYAMMRVWEMHESGGAAR